MSLEEHIYGQPNARRLSAPTSSPRFIEPAPPSLIQIWNIMSQITNGVMFIHDEGEIHRDLKPQNGITLGSKLLNELVLYSGKDKAWKIADFGFTSEGTASRFHTSKDARGTPSYRPPELLQDGKRVFNNKVDIWALGCILHELVVRRKAFPGDWAVHRHSDSGKEFNVSLDETFNQETKTCISETIQSMLQIIPSARPTASTLFEKFQRFYKCGDDQTHGNVHIDQDVLHNSPQNPVSLVSENLTLDSQGNGLPLPFSKHITNV